jgi:hypothetical protein
MDGVPTKILLATDGTEDATQAAQAAIDLSEKGGIELHEASQSRSNARRTRFDCGSDLAGAYLFSCREAGRARGAAPKFWSTTQPSIPCLTGCFRSGNTRVPKPAAGLGQGEGRCVVASALLPALIHPSAWKVNSRKSVSRILHSRGPLPGSLPC